MHREGGGIVNFHCGGGGRIFFGTTYCQLVMDSHLVEDFVIYKLIYCLEVSFNVMAVKYGGHRLLSNDGGKDKIP